MDWGRAKTVLILAFLLLNTVLGYQLWLEWRERLDSAVDWTSLPAETQENMSKKGIRVEAQIPTETPEMREITYRLKDTSAIRSDSRVELSPQPNTRVVFVEAELQQTLGGVIPELNKYRFDNLGSTEKMFVLNRTVDGWPIFDVRVLLYYKDQKITAYRQDRIDMLPAGDAKLQKVLPASKAVASLIDRNYLPIGAVVKEIQLGYHGQIYESESETQVSTPSWRVLLEDGEVFFVQAITGEVMSDQGEQPDGQPNGTAEQADK